MQGGGPVSESLMVVGDNVPVTVTGVVRVGKGICGQRHMPKRGF